MTFKNQYLHENAPTILQRRVGENFSTAVYKIIESYCKHLIAVVAAKGGPSIY